jgi:hypothetical protein
MAISKIKIIFHFGLLPPALLNFSNKACYDGIGAGNRIGRVYPPLIYK